MFDSGILTASAVAVASLFTVSLFVGEEILIDEIDVPIVLELDGYTDDTVTRLLTDELREINETAASLVTGIDVDETALERGLSPLDDFFNVTDLINGARDILGLIPFWVIGEITENNGKLVFTTRIYTPDEEDAVHLVIVNGDVDGVRAMLHDAAIGMLDLINPYVVTLYYRRLEEKAGRYDFPETYAAVDRYLESRPLDEHYLVYGLRGRAHMIAAEQDASLTPEEREREYDLAIRDLRAALVQNPDFLFPHVNLATIYARRGDYTVAEGYFAEAVSANPDYEETRIGWGDMLSGQGRTLDAIHQYVAAVEIEPEDATLRDKLANLYMEAGIHEAAREQWLEAMRINPLAPEYERSLRLLESADPVPVNP